MLPVVPRIRTERMVDVLVAQFIAALPDLVRARAILDQVSMIGDDRAAFAASLLTLELALRNEPRARDELPGRVGILMTAAGDSALATGLLAGSTELETRWERAKPVVADFLAARGRSPAVSGDEDFLIDVEETPPPLPDDLSPSSYARFWAFTEQALGRLPEGEAPGMPSFLASRGSDRSRLVHFAKDLLARFPNSPHARALAALTFLFVAAHKKERGLFGPNRDRLDLIRNGLSLLGDPVPASQVAALFESDGPQTREDFAGVIDIVVSFLAFCMREKLDPADGDTVARFVDS